MIALVQVPNTGVGSGSGQVTAAAFLVEARANPVYGVGTFSTVAQVLPYLKSLANQLAADCPAGSGVKNKTAPDTRCQLFLAELIVAAGG